MLFKVGIICSLIAATLAFDGRIVNGTNAAEGQYPYAISLRVGMSHNCGGSILDATHILTAAHCVQGKLVELLSVQYGVTDITDNKINSIAVKSFVYHPHYTPGQGYNNDIAVVTLVSPMVLSDKAKKTVLPKMEANTPENLSAILVGWGYQMSNGSVQKHLQTVGIKVYSDVDCAKAHYPYTDRKYHVCAGIPEGGKGQCSGDSGGPLTVNGVQVGIVSWSVKPCAVKGYPGVFAKVSTYIDWINEQLKN